ncbi:hypothetical protein GCG21_11535 [Pseudactinotalea sp. HY160]|uniref:hypothetical protein n=1 Tax=Pseudactinotalea sp. HY160 TaxID=2654490 RepID=UPI00128BAE6D|nr:hypothetical protein [Pseudactinotalea sp. HY160]MPV50625.1 hypothetical protein [Pseudactinotalea sp. HY160]
MENISVIVAGSSSVATDVRALAASWVSQGIIGPSLWVGGEDVIDEPGMPMRVTATLLEVDGERQVDLFTYLGKYRLRLLRLVVAHLATVSGVNARELTELGIRIGQAMRDALPREHSGVDVSRLHRSVVVIPASGVTGLDPRILAPSWEANVVISPEDRPDLDRMSIFVRPDRNYVGHAAAALAAGAGIIRGIPDGAFDEVTLDSSTQPGDLVVARVSIRAVVGERVIDVIARRVLDPATLAPDGAARIVSWGLPASEPDLIAQRAAKSILADPEWAAAAPPDSGAPRSSKEPLGVALLDAARFNLRTAAAVGVWTFSRGRSNVERVATGQIVGTSAGAFVTIGPRAVDHAASVAHGILAAQQRTADDEIAYEATRGTPPAPSTWIRLRDLAFSLADGSPMTGGEEPVQFGRREILAPGDVVPAPGTGYQCGDGAQIDALDLTALSDYREALKVRRRAATDALEPLDTGQYVTAEHAEAAPVSEPETEETASDGGRYSTGHGEGAVTAEESDEFGPDPVAGPEAGDPSAPDDSSEPEDSGDSPTSTDPRQTVEELRRKEEEFTAWYAENTRSVLSRVGVDVERRLRMHEANRRRFLERRHDVTAPATDALEHAKKKLLRRWWGWSVGGTLVTAGIVAWALWIAENPDWMRVSMAAGVVVLFSLLILAFASHSFYKAFRSYEWAIATVLAQQRHETAQFLWEGKQLARLRVLFAGWRAWAEVIAEVVHQPWGPVTEHYADLSLEVIDQLPAAMAVARQAESQLDIDDALVVAAYRAIYREGWADQAFSEGYEHFSERSQRARTAGFLDVDIDVTGSDLGARSQFLRLWQSGAVRTWLGGRRTERLRELSSQGGLDVPHRVVGRIGKYSDGSIQEEPFYFLPMITSETTLVQEVFTPRALSESRHYIKAVRIWLPPVAQATAEAQSMLDQPGVAAKNSDTATAVRVDLSTRLRPQEVAIFAGSAEVPAQPMTDYSHGLLDVSVENVATENEFF